MPLTYEMHKIVLLRVRCPAGLGSYIYNTTCSLPFHCISEISSSEYSSPDGIKLTVRCEILITDYIVFRLYY